jgi:hypothetical protein
MAEQDRTEEQAVDGQGDEAEMMARLQEEIGNLPVGDHLAYMMHSLSALAVGRLGLTADTAERRDLGQARLAIDAFKALLVVLEQVRPTAELAVHRGMLSQLQLTYAGAIGKAGAEDQPEAAAERPEVPPESREVSRDSKEAPLAGGAPRKKAAAPTKPVAPSKKPEAPAEKPVAPRKARKSRQSSQNGS